MKNFSLTLCRFCLSAWVGAAALFVTVGVAEVRFLDNDATIKNSLVALRFPYYYQFGFTLVIAGLLTSVIARNHSQWTSGRASLTTGLLLLALVLMLGDYLLIYQPLLAMLKQESLPSTFQKYHEFSKNINLADLCVILLAALLSCWPAPERSTQEDMTP